MKKIIYLISILLFSISINSFAQTRIVVNVEDDLLVAAQSASAGDTLWLVQGLHKAQYDNIIVDKSLVFKGAPGSEMPKLYIKQFDVAGNDVSLALYGLEISGFGVDSLTGVESQETPVADYLINLISGTTANAFGDIIVQDCVVRNFNRSMVRGDRDTYHVANFLFDDIIAHDFRGGGDYGPFRLKSKITFDTFTLSNSTMYNFLNKIIDTQDVIPSPMVVTLENCTFHNLGGGKSGNYLFDIEDNDQATLIIQSCIFGRTNVAELVTVNGWRVIEGATNQMKNSVMTPEFVIEVGDYETTVFDLTEYNLEDFDPEWADPDNGDFTLPLGSDLLEWSPEGTIVGDPRWHPLIDNIFTRKTNPGIEIYPNPASGYVNVKMKDLSDLEIYNVTGLRLKSVKVTSHELRIDISDLNPGIYFIRKANENRMAGKIIVR